MSLDVSALGPGDVVAGKLRVVRKLGEGGMGCVFEVEHTFTKHRRALKLLHGRVVQNRDALQRFLQEASAAGRIGNPHIADTFDAGVLESGEPFLVMELLQGETLGDLAERHGGRLPLITLIDLLAQTAGAIASAHQAGIVHRDLKPENLFVVRQGGRPFVKVLDFGISKFADPGASASTREGSLLGTPYYMSPEQFRGDRTLDARADVYSLGVVLYELASGRRPFEAESLPALALCIAEGKPAPLGSLCPDLPDAFVALVERAMASDRAIRFQTALDLARALEAVRDALDHDGSTLAGSEESGLPASIVPTHPLADPFEATAAVAAEADSLDGGPEPAAVLFPAPVAPRAEPLAAKAPFWIGLALLMPVLALAAWLTRTQSSERGSAASSSLSAPAAASASADTVVTAAASTEPAAPPVAALPASTTTVIAPAVAASATISASTAAVTTVIARPKPTPPPAKTGETRGQHHGLADDPYSK